MNPEQNGGPLPPQYQNQPVPGSQLPPQPGSPYPPQGVGQPYPNQAVPGPQPAPQPAPQQYPAQPAPIASNQYDFIMNPEKPAKKPVVPLPLPTNNPILMRVVIAVAGLVVLIILAVIVSSVLSSGGKDKTEALLTIAQDQTELIRISTAGATTATTLPVQTLAQSVQASVTSDNVALLSYMEGTGQKVTPVQLALKKSKTADTTLATAQDNSTYDTAFKDVIQTDLSSYMTALQKAYKLNPGPKGQDLLSKQYKAADTLLKLSKQN